MNIRTRAALMLLVSAMPSRQVSVQRVISLSDKLNKLRADLELVPLNQGKADVRDLLTMILSEVGGD